MKGHNAELLQLKKETTALREIAQSLAGRLDRMLLQSDSAKPAKRHKKAAETEGRLMGRLLTGQRKPHK